MICVIQLGAWYFGPDGSAAAAGGGGIYALHHVLKRQAVRVGSRRQQITQTAALSPGGLPLLHTPHCTALTVQHGTMGETCPYEKFIALNNNFLCFLNPKDGL